MTSLINITLHGQPGGSKLAVLTDLAGRVIKTQTGNGNVLQIDVAALPAGCYLVSCFENGIKIATSRFIKNGE